MRVSLPPKSPLSGDCGRLCPGQDAQGALAVSPAPPFNTCLFCCSSGSFVSGVSSSHPLVFCGGEGLPMGRPFRWDEHSASQTGACCVPAVRDVVEVIGSGRYKICPSDEQIHCDFPGPGAAWGMSTQYSGLGWSQSSGSPPPVAGSQRSLNIYTTVFKPVAQAL